MAECRISSLSWSFNGHHSSVPEHGAKTSYRVGDDQRGELCVFQNFCCPSDVKRQMHLADDISARSPFDELEDTRPAPTALAITNRRSMQRYVDALQ